MNFALFSDYKNSNNCINLSYSYMRCATCCHGNSESVCRVHGTGYLVAERSVESAILYRLYQCDIRSVLLVITSHSTLMFPCSYSNLSVCPPALTDIGQQLVRLHLLVVILTEIYSTFLEQVTLNLSNNRLKYLPDKISQLTGLQELFLQYNQLSALSVCTYIVQPK